MSAQATAIETRLDHNVITVRGTVADAAVPHGPQTFAFIDIDSTQKRVFGYHKQGARFGHTKIQGKSLLVRGLNALAGVISTPLSAPVIAAARLRGGNAASSRGAASLAKEAIGTARNCGCTGLIIVIRERSSREPVVMEVGPVLDLEDVLGGKVCALAVPMSVITWTLRRLWSTSARPS